MFKVFPIGNLPDTRTIERVVFVKSLNAGRY